MKDENKYFDKWLRDTANTGQSASEEKDWQQMEQLLGKSSVNASPHKKRKTIFIRLSLLLLLLASYFVYRNVYTTSIVENKPHNEKNISGTNTVTSSNKESNSTYTESLNKNNDVINHLQKNDTSNSLNNPNLLSSTPNNTAENNHVRYNDSKQQNASSVENTKTLKQHLTNTLNENQPNASKYISNSNQTKNNLSVKKHSQRKLAKNQNGSIIANDLLKSSVIESPTASQVYDIKHFNHLNETSIYSKDSSNVFTEYKNPNDNLNEEISSTEKGKSVLKYLQPEIRLVEKIKPSTQLKIDSFAFSTLNRLTKTNRAKKTSLATWSVGFSFSISNAAGNYIGPNAFIQYDKRILKSFSLQAGLGAGFRNTATSGVKINHEIRTVEVLNSNSYRIQYDITNYTIKNYLLLQPYLGLAYTRNKINIWSRVAPYYTFLLKGEEEKTTASLALSGTPRTANSTVQKAFSKNAISGRFGFNVNVGIEYTWRPRTYFFVGYTVFVPKVMFETEPENTYYPAFFTSNQLQLGFRFNLKK